MVDLKGEVKEPPPKKFIVSSILSRTVEQSMFASVLKSSAQSSPFREYWFKSVTSIDGRYSVIDPLVLVHNWNVRVEIAKRTIQCTTRICPRNTTSISLHKRYPANDCMIWYKHLNCTFGSLVLLY